MGIVEGKSTLVQPEPDNLLLPGLKAYLCKLLEFPVWSEDGAFDIPDIDLDDFLPGQGTGIFDLETDIQDIPVGNLFPVKNHIAVFKPRIGQAMAEWE